MPREKALLPASTVSARRVNILPVELTENSQGVEKHGKIPAY